ncbi:unnamed protein product [Rotaria sordida]|uniref:F-box domain-containing protein n=2 Tax=Rotaria sordida TaxID=392033 RepID=A0A819RWJ4_9BILA|nr:unnamed protein product [Rotaria sordida]
MDNYDVLHELDSIVCFSQAEYISERKDLCKENGGSVDACWSSSFYKVCHDNERLLYGTGKQNSDVFIRAKTARIILFTSVGISMIWQGVELEESKAMIYDQPKKFHKWRMMCNYISHEISTLELFPDELFLELFSFINPIDLYHGFINLNSRLNNILNDIRICIHIINDDQYEDYQACLNHFAYQIIYLAIDCHWSRLSYNINLQSFVNLRSLYLPMPTDEQCLEITSDNLPFLTNLTINDNTFKSILFGSNLFSHLVTLCVPCIYSSILKQIESMQLCLTLHSLYLGSCTIIDVLNILPYLPNLNYLDIALLPNNKTIHQSDVKHKNIFHFKVKLRKLDPDLEILLKSMSNLHRLEFLWNESYTGIWYNGPNSFNFEKFSDILEKNSVSLKRIDIHIHISRCDYDIDYIRHLNLQWFSSLNKIKITNNGSFFITTKKLSTDAEEKMITTLLQSTYMTQRNTRIHRVKINKV